jgi:hypothetical protein
MSWRLPSEAILHSMPTKWGSTRYKCGTVHVAVLILRQHFGVQQLAGSGLDLLFWPRTLPHTCGTCTVLGV